MSAQRKARTRIGFSLDFARLSSREEEGPHPRSTPAPGLTCRPHGRRGCPIGSLTRSPIPEVLPASLT